MVLVSSLLLIGVASAVSAVMKDYPQVSPVIPKEEVISYCPPSTPWVMGIFFLFLLTSELSFGTLLLYYFGSRRSHGVGIIPLELEEDELDRLFEEFMRVP